MLAIPRHGSFPWLAAILALAFAVPAARAAPAAAAKTPTPSETSEPLEIHDTGANLQRAFGGEVNAHHRYLEAAKVAESEGRRDVAALFRACATAEQAHADRHVEAIAWTSGGEARAMMARLSLGTTLENLQLAAALEDYEVQSLYPALLERAKTEGHTEAVRSFNFALSAEREHARLLRSALDRWNAGAGPAAFHVCPKCGKTVVDVTFPKCPNCFTSARRFVRVS